MSQILSCRIYEEKDLDAIIQLWARFSGWGTISMQQFKEWYIDTPFGTSIITVAESETGEIVGQTIFMPARAIVRKQRVNVLRVLAPVIHHDVRGINIRDYNHPVYTMFRFGVDVAIRRGFCFIYSFPSVGWLAMVKTFNKHGIPLADMASFDCIGYSLTDSPAYDERRVRDTSVYIEDNINDEYDILWEESVNHFPVNTGIIRDSVRSRFKLGPHLLLAVRSSINGKLIGYTAIRKQNGLITDALARTPDDLECVVHGAIKYLYQNSSGLLNPGLKEIKAILFPATRSVFESVRHHHVDYKFAFFCSHLGDSSGAVHLTADQWFMMPDD